MKVKNFIKQVQEIKNKKELDLSLDQDLSIGLMNLVSLEEHFIFSFMKTSDKRYLEMLEQVRELRKRLLKKIVKENDGENWCISKHLLATSMRLMEVGNKYLHSGNKKKAENIFYDAFNIYSMFWAVNGVVDKKKFKEIGKSVGSKKLSKISLIVKKILDCCKE